ncbi:hypothetical protein [Dysgonomonas termitidis]
MRKSPYKEPKQVLIFNNAKVLIAIVRSLHAASELSFCNLQAISFCCLGKYISTGGYYFRHVHPDIAIEPEDLDNLKLEEYDRMCGEERLYYSSRQLARKRMLGQERRKAKWKNRDIK